MEALDSVAQSAMRGALALVKYSSRVANPGAVLSPEMPQAFEPVLH
jgi:hypothetical protein